MAAPKGVGPVGPAASPVATLTGRAPCPRAWPGHLRHVDAWPRPMRGPLTGHVGARTKRAVALVTDDFRLYHRLVPFFERHGLQVLGLRPGQEVPASVRVLLDGPPEDPRSVPVRDSMEATWLATVAALDERPVVEDGPRHAVLGVDPGLTIGLAVLVDGRLYWVAEADTPEAAVEKILAWREGLSPRHWSVHVGHGSPEVGARILAILGRRFPEAALHRVHEGASTPGSAVTKSRHTDAAVRIAQRPPL